MWVFLILLLWLIRMNTVYREELRFKKYITIKNEFLRKMLISKSMPGMNFKGEYRVKEEDKDKILIHGLVFYVVWFVTVLVCLAIQLYILYMGENLEVDIRPYELALTVWILALMSLEIGFVTYNIIGKQNSLNESEKIVFLINRITKIGCIILVLVSLVCVVVLVILMILILLGII